MKKLYTVAVMMFLAILVACGNEVVINEPAAVLTLEPTEIPTEVVDTPAFNQLEIEALEKSRAAWNEKNQSGNYTYSTSFESWVGFGSQTLIFVTNNVVTGRNYSSYDENREPDESYEEDASNIGSSRYGAPVKTIDELYDDCAEILKTKPPTENYITFKVFDDNLLNACTFFPMNCADDCSEGPRLDWIRFDE